MKNVLLIAVGGIGFRHFQALLNCTTACNLYVLDVSAVALDKARAYSTMESKNRTIVLAASTDDLAPMHFDLVIIATPSLPRRMIFEKLVSRHEVDIVIFEKVLFPCIEDYGAISELLKAKHIRAYVNCVRRTWDIYGTLKQDLMNASHIHARVIGTEWGLSCNVIHMIDVFDYLAATDAQKVFCNGELLENEIFPSKRNGYIEFFGTLMGRISERLTYSVTCNHGTQISSIIELITDRDCYRIDEGSGRMLRKSFDGTQNEERGFDVPLVSQTTTKIVDALLIGKEVSLADYETSARLHVPVLHALLRKQTYILGKEETQCNIT